MPKPIQKPSRSVEFAAADVLQSDWSWAQRQLARMRRGQGKAKDIEQQLEQRLKKSARQVQNRLASIPSIHCDEQLPISARAEEIVEAIQKHQVVVVAGATGSGKSTQLPKLCLAAGRGARGLIGCTQPRRIAARSVAARVAEELAVELGGLVGFQVRFTDQTAAQTLIKFMTDGILLAETQRDRYFDAYDTIIIDEAHERSLNIDFLLGLLKRILPKRPDLRVIVTSATIDTERFADYFHAAPIINVEGRTYPVEIRYRPLPEERGERGLYLGIAEAIDELSRIDKQGDMLVFLPGEREIRDTANFLRRRNLKFTEILPLYARLSAKAQMQVFKPGPQRRIVLATNVAETSLTVPRIKFVIDPGLARIGRYSHRSRVQRLPIEPISQASANQRSGRCGRLSAGVAIRLYSEEDFALRPEFTEPEILRTSLATVILRMLDMRLGDIGDFPFIEPPAQVMISDALQLLRELQALEDTDEQRLTTIGRQLARLPIDVRMARMLLEGQRLGCLPELLVLTAALSIQDPRERPMEQAQAADQAQAEFVHPQSDFMSYLKLWVAFHQQKQDNGSSALRRWCERHFLSWVRMREWLDLHRQLQQHARELGWKTQAVAADWDAGYQAGIHQGLLSGMLSMVGLRDDADSPAGKGKKAVPKSYLGARARRFHVFPGSALVKSSPRWLMAAELVETSKVFARVCAAIKPEWLEQQAAHVLKHRYFDPFWDAQTGQVLGYVQSTLYGLPVVERRKVHYAPHDPATAHQLFIEHALVNGEVNIPAARIPPFMAKNQALVESLQTAEHKRRRHDVLERVQARIQFFAGQVPQTVNAVKDFLSWHASLKNTDQLLYPRSVLLRDEALLDEQTAYPDEWVCQGQIFALSYQFDPAKADDGVTLQVPLMHLNMVDANQLSWLVPGLLEERLAALINTLPKPQRRAFSPARHFARAVLERLQWPDALAGEAFPPITRLLAEQLTGITGNQANQLDWDESALPPHLRMHIQLLDEQGKPVASSRDLEALREQFGGKARRVFMREQGSAFERNGMTQWEVGDLSATVSTPSGVKAWPALTDQGDSCGLRLFDNPHDAWLSHQAGLLVLVRLALQQKINYIHKNHGFTRDMQLQSQKLDGWQAVRDDLLHAVLSSLLSEHDIYTQGQYDDLLEQLQPALLPAWQQRVKLLQPVLASYHQANLLLGGALQKHYPKAWLDARGQLDDLVYPGVFRDLGWHALQHYPRYLQALVERLERLALDPHKDRERQQLVAPYWQRYLQYLEQGGEYGEAMDSYRWLLEEYRVSLFAQQLGTRSKVSPQRLEKAWSQVLDAAK